MEEDRGWETALCGRVGEPSPMALAGLWENWRSLTEEWVRSFAIIKTTPNALCAELQNRMPVVLGPQVWEPADLPRLKAFLAPYPMEEMTCWVRQPPGRKREKQRP